MNTPSNLAIVYLLHQEIDSWHEDWAAEKPLRTGWPHASTVLQPESEWCLRRQVLLVMYPDEARQPGAKPWHRKQNAIFLNGWALHEKMQKLMGKYGQIVYYNEHPELDYTHFDPQRNLYYSPDAIATFAGDTYLWELKFYKQEYFDKLDERKDPPQAAWHQANLYCHLLELKRGVVYVESKDDSSQRKIWIIDHDKELAWPYTDRCEQVRGSVLRRHIPTKVCTSCTEHRAEKCPVKDLCFSGKLKEK